jgi:hypothetical protein
MGILAELLSSKIRAEIFRNLLGIAPNKALYMREIERRTGFAIHPLYPDIRNRVLKTSGLADVIKDAIGNEKEIRIAFVRINPAG